MKDEVLKKLNNTDSSVIPRYDIVLPTGEVVYSRVQLILQNTVLEEGTPLNKANLLSDDTSASLGLDPATSTPDVAFAKLMELVRGFCPKVGVRFTPGGTVYIRNESTLEVTQSQVATSGAYQGVAAINLYAYGGYTVWGVYDGVRKDYPSLLVVDTVRIYDIDLTK